MSKLNRLSNVASVSSFLCAIHCMAMPFLIAFLPIIGIGFIRHGWMEVATLIVAVGFSLASLCWGYKIHGSVRAFAFLVAGAAWLWLSAQEHRNHFVFSAIGGSCLLVANLLNRRLCNTCGNCKKHAI